MLRTKVESKVIEVTENFKMRKDIKCIFGEPMVSFVNASDEIYEVFHNAGLSRMPKLTYRPGNTVITHYVPIIEKPESMARAHFESIWLAMEINRGIKSVFRDYGRLTSYTSSLVEWDEEKAKYDWDDRIAAYIAGIGKIGPAGSLKVSGSYGGRSSSMIVDLFLADEKKYENPESEIDDYLNSACYQAADEKLISLCPASAITEDGINRKACQEYCKGINPSTPCPEVCGKCFITI